MSSTTENSDFENKNDITGTTRHGLFIRYYQSVTGVHILQYNESYNYNENNSSSYPFNFTINQTDSTIDGISSEFSMSYSTGTAVFLCLILGILILWTIFGNVLVLIALWKYKKLRSVSNLLIGNLAFGDFMIGLTVLPYSTVDLILGRWIFGEIFCNVWLSTDVLCCTASIWSLCVISVDRFTATIFPLWYRTHTSTKTTSYRALVYLLVIWTIAISISGAPYLGWVELDKNFTEEPSGKVFCVLFQKTTYVIYSACGSFFVPSSILITLYSYIVIFLLKKSAEKQKRTETFPLRKLKLTTAKTSTLPPSNKLESIPEQAPLKQTEEPKTNDTVIRPSCSDEIMRGYELDIENDSIDDVTTSDNKIESHLKYTSAKSFSIDDDQIAELALAAGTTIDPHSTDSTERKTSTLSINAALKIPDPYNLFKDQFYRECKERKMSAGALQKFATRLATVAKVSRFNEREKTATKRMGMIISCFIFSWLPFFSLYLARGFCLDDCIDGHLMQFTIWLGYSNSAQNPILYTLFNEEFKKAFKRILHCRN